MKTLTKYTLKEILGPLFFGFFAFTSMFLGFLFIDLLRDAEKYRLSIFYLVRLLVLRLPEYVIHAAPIAVLLATLMGLGKLTSHSETIAMRAGGLSYAKLAGPILTIGLIVSISGVLMNEYVVPVSLRTYAQLKLEAGEKGKTAVVSHFNQNFYQNNRIQKRIYADQYDPRTRELRQVTIEEFSGGRLNRIITTSAMYWDGRGWYFKQGLIYQINFDNFYPIKVDKGYVKYQLDITPKEIARYDEEPEKKSISELWRYIDKYFPDGPERQGLLVDLHLKFAIPFASFILALLGTPLALRPQRRSNAAGFGLCVIFILLWYGLMGVGTYWAREGSLSPFLGAWLPNFILAGYGVNVFRQVKS